MRHTGTDAVVAGDLATAILAYVRSNPDLTSTDDDWRVRSIAAQPGEPRHVRLDQLHAGVRVWGADIVVHVAGDRVRSTGGNLVRGLAGLDVTATLAAGRALELAKADYASKVRVAAAPLAYKREKTELVILPRPGLDTRLAWYVEFFTERQAGTHPGRWNYFIDARTGELLKLFNAIDTLSQASGPGGNPNVARTWTAKLDVEPQAGGPFVMNTAKYQTYDMNNTEDNGVLVTGPLNPIGDAAINDAHGFAEVTVRMLNQWFGHDSIDDAGFIIRSRVHYSVNFENAFWNGVEMTYGDGDTALYPLSGDVDVVSHEINHGFTEFHSGLIYDGESGGMNESFSDVVGTAAEFFDEGAAADWTIGGDLFINDGVIRFMCDPTMDGISVDHYSDYFPGMDPHFSSGISNKAFCRAARRLATGNPDGTATVASVRRAASAWVEANANHWNQSTTFQQACQGVMDAATALGFSTVEKNRIRASWVDVGVFCDGDVEPLICDETLTTASGTITSPNYPSNYPDDYSHIWCIDPPGTQQATLVFDAFFTEDGYDFVEIKNGVTGAVLSTTSGSTAPADATARIVVVKFTTDQSVNESGWTAHWGTGPGTPDAAPGTPDAAPGTPDAAPGTPDASPGTPDASPGTPDAAPGTPDADTAPDGDPGPGDDDGGCCSTGSNPAGALPLIALVGVLLIRPRRRRTRC